MAFSAFSYFLVVVSSASNCPQPAPELHRFETSEVQMGTTFRLVFYATDGSSASLASRAAFDRIAQLNQIMSDYLDDSELTMLSQSAGGPPVRVNDELFDLLKRSVRFSHQTDGAFDITIGPVVRLWRRARRQRKLPEKDLISDYLKRVGYRQIKLNDQKRTVQLLGQKMRLDLGGIAKGYACDQALATLQVQGIHSALVDGGGDIVLGNAPPHKDGWEIQVASPGGKMKTLELANLAIATSGDTAQFVEIQGKRYSHIVDPATGIGLTNRSQVTVIAPDGTTADALASALSVLGPRKGFLVLKQFPETAALIQIDDHTGPQIFASPTWPKRATSLGARLEPTN